VETSAPMRSRGQAGITLVELLVSMIILGIVTTMLIAGWTSLQSSYAQSVNANNARAEVRDAVARMSREIRDAQPATLTLGQSPFTVANPLEVDFYSAFNNHGTKADGTGIGVLRLTRYYLDTSGSTPQKTLCWQRDTNNSGTFDAADRKVILARAVVNMSIPNTHVTPNAAYTSIFTYGYRDGSGNFTTADTIASADLATIISVQIHLLVDANLSHSPAYADLQTTVRPRNAPQN
jgi:type II secretory pathway pseudopilin PulG